MSKYFQKGLLILTEFPQGQLIYNWTVIYLNYSDPYSY